jgi:hypothetical protein
MKFLFKKNVELIVNFQERETPKDQLVDLSKFFPGFERANELIDEGAERFEDDF